MKDLDHPHIIKLYCVYNTSKRVILNTEFCGDITLQDYLRSYPNMIREEKIKDIFRSVAKAIGYCHSKGVCHRDLKLDNILINHEGVIKLIDFGFAIRKTATNDKITDFCGTPSYMSPEIVQRRPYDGLKSDIWALGILLYKLLIGRYPFKGCNDEELYKSILHKEPTYNSNISPAVKFLIAGMLIKNPVKRISAEEILNDPWFNY